MPHRDRKSVSIHDAARLLGITVRGVRNRIRKGQFPEPITPPFAPRRWWLDDIEKLPKRHRGKTFAENIIEDANGCHIWTGAIEAGVPRTNPQKGQPRRYLRRQIWEEAGLPLTRQLKIEMLCGTPLCVNVDHMAAMKAGNPKGSNARERGNLDERDLEAIREGLRRGKSQAKIAAEIGVHQATISRAVKRMETRHD